jgi:hypothetical protein
MNGALTELMAVARAHVEAGRLGDAQGALVEAGRIAPNDADVFCSLGEVLLRRGDAERAARALTRAAQLAREGRGAARSHDAHAWLARAQAYLPLQAERGSSAVASAVAHQFPVATAQREDDLPTAAYQALPSPAEGFPLGALYSADVSQGTAIGNADAFATTAVHAAAMPDFMDGAIPAAAASEDAVEEAATLVRAPSLRPPAAPPAPHAAPAPSPERSTPR